MENVLKNMLNDVKAHQRPREKLLEFYINLRLDKALDTYYKQLVESYSIISGINDIKVLKNLAKE